MIARNDICGVSDIYDGPAEQGNRPDGERRHGRSSAVKNSERSDRSAVGQGYVQQGGQNTGAGRDAEGEKVGFFGERGLAHSHLLFFEPGSLSSQFSFFFAEIATPAAQAGAQEHRDGSPED